MRLALSILGGYAVIAALVLALFAVYGLLGHLPEDGSPPDPGTAFLVGSVLWGVVAAAVGAYVTVWLSRRDNWSAPLGLVVFCWLMGYASLVAGDSREPLWLSLSHFGSMLVGVTLGAWLRLRRVTART